MKRKLNSSNESSFVRSIAEHLIFKYKSQIRSFEYLNVKDIIFLRDNILKVKIFSPIEISLALPETVSLSNLKFIVTISDKFDELSKAEQERLVFHTLLHIPYGYKETFTETGKIILRNHDLELFNEEETIIHDILAQEKDRDFLDNQKNLKRKPLDYS